MARNMGEWCWDWFEEDYYAHSPEKDPKGPESGSYRIFRGGTWFGGPAGNRVAYRAHSPIRDGAPFMFGFRIARSTLATAADSVSFKAVPLSVEEGGGVQLTWPSVEGRRYRIRRADDMPEWRLLVNEIQATPPLNTFIDDEPSPSGQAYYQLNVVK